MQILNQGLHRGNLNNYENNNDSHFRLSRSNFLDLETLPKLVFTILVPLQILQDQLCILTNFGFLPRTLASKNYKAYPTK